jgi:hypothetical protein
MKTGHSFIYRMLLIFLLVAGCPLINPCLPVYAQGIYSRNEDTSGDDEDDEDGGTGLFRAGGTENPDDGGQASKMSPLKDGWSLLVIAGVGYGFFIARRKDKPEGDIT